MNTLKAFITHSMSPFQLTNAKIPQLQVHRMRNLWRITLHFVAVFATRVSVLHNLLFRKTGNLFTEITKEVVVKNSRDSK